MLSPSLAGVRDAIRHSWLLVVITGVVAAAVGFAFTVEAGVSHRAVSVIAINNMALERASGIVLPDFLLQEITGTEFAEEVAARVGEDVTASEVARGLSANTAGRPYKELKITFTSDDAAQAEAVARTAGEVTAEMIDRLNALERSRHESAIASAEQLLVELDAEEVDTPWERTDVASRRYSARNSIATAQYNLTLFDRAYQLEPAAAVAEVVERDRRLENSVGAAVLGIALGIGLAVIREKMAARHAR
jgi:hypothetical protein